MQKNNKPNTYPETKMIKKSEHKESEPKKTIKTTNETLSWFFGEKRDKLSALLTRGKKRMV